MKLRFLGLHWRFLSAWLGRTVRNRSLIWGTLVDAFVPDCAVGGAGHMVILYVEDDDDLRETIRELLVDRGFDVDVACSASDGLASLEARHYDLLLTDQSLPPGNTGAWLLAEAAHRGLLDGTACLMVTGEQNVVTESPCEQLHKPIELNQLPSVIHRLLEPNRLDALNEPAADQP